MEYTPEHHTEKELDRRFSAAKEVRLDPRESSRMRSVLAAKIRGAGIERDTTRRPMARGVSFFTLFLRPVPAMLLIAVFIISGSGISFAAEGALPGDLLYPVKVTVNEEIRARLAFSDEAKTEWEAARVERRLEEAETLVEQGRLDAEIRVEIEERFEKHAERMRGRIEAFEEGGNVESAAAFGSNLETVLNTHERILEKLAGLGAGPGLATTMEVRSASAMPESVARGSREKKEVESLLKKIRSRKRGVQEARTGAEGKVANLTETAARRAAEARMQSAEKKIRDVREKLDDVRQYLGEESAANIEVRFAAAASALADGSAALGKSAANQAFLDFQRAFRIAQEAELLIKASERLERDMIANGFSREDDDDREDFDDDADEDTDEHDEDEGEETGEEARRIQTRFGELELKRHDDGTTELRGMLSRENPCVNWKLNVSTSSGGASARAEIKIQKEVTSEVCIQMLGKPQEIRAKVQMKDRAEYRVSIDGETVFEGTIGDSSGSGGSGDSGQGGEDGSRVETEVNASANTGGNRGGTIREGDASVNVEIRNEINQ